MNPVFSNPPTIAASLLLAVFSISAPVMAAPVPLSELMPRPGDYTSMWWAEGFPGVIPQAPWKRCVQTGFYVMEQDTVSLQFSHLGPVQAGMSYLKFGEKAPPIPQVPSPAKLELLLKADGKLYQCSKGGPGVVSPDPA